MNFYETRENYIHTLNFFRFEYTNDQSLFKSLAVFDFGSNFVQVKSFKDTVTTKWVQNIFPSWSLFRQNLSGDRLFYA